MSFKAVDSKVSLPQLEEKTLAWWKENKVFERSIEERPGDNMYTFVDGPPFVSGSPHYGHLLASIAKDLIPRYQTMNGKRVRRVWGWDCHGLPIEEKVNKQFGIKTSHQLEEKFGIKRYVEECRKYVESTSSDWRWYVEKIGRWVDMDNAYYTMNVEFMESVIWAFKQIYEKGYIYKGKRVSLFSTDTSTPVSQFEVAMDADNYQDVEDLSVFVKFSLNDLPEFLVNEFTNGRKLYMVAWTTTPWTIPANFALAVNKNFEYALVQYENEMFIVAKDRIEYTFNVDKGDVGDKGDSLVRVIAEFKGDKLEGLKYQPVFDFFVKDSNDNDFTVYLSDDVTSDEGTGVLHIAPAFGEVDFLLGQKYGLTALRDIDEEGKMTVGPWKGTYLRDASPMITEDMQVHGALLRSVMYTHRLPFYRGKNPLIYMAQDAYFIDIQKIKTRMSELNEDINWIPKHIKKGRFGLTIENSPDWCISRNRYWATIMPIWESGDGEQIIIGSLEEFTQYTDQVIKKEDGKYYFGNQPMDLHRDVCDEIVLKKDGKEYRRIPEVLDCWMDSGSVPFAEYHFPFENKEEFERAKSADFIIEYIGQVRAWFNVLLRLSTLIFDENAFTNVICTGVIAGSDGRKMSKSYGNYPDPRMLLERYGGDALRLYLMGSAVMKGEDMNFSEEGVAENYRFLLTYWNCYKYFVDYANIFNWSCHLEGANGDKSRLKVLDHWILSRLTQLVLDVRKNLDKYDIPQATKILKEFLVEDFSTWYIRRSRDRVSNNPDEIDRNVCLSVMYGVLVGFTKVAAPFIPFITEEMYLNIASDESVHLAIFPAGDKSLIDDQLVKDMIVVREIVESGHAQRKEANMKLRQPLGGVKYVFSRQLSAELEEVIKEELNVKAVEFTSGNDEIKVELHVTLTDELKEEGEAREIIRTVQQLRKDSGLILKDKIKVLGLPSWPVQFEEMILSATGSEKIVKADSIQIIVPKK